MKKILLFTLFIFTVQSLSANSISVQGVLRDNNNRAVPDKEEGYNMTFTIYSDSLGGGLVWGPTTYNGVDVLNGVYSLELNVGTELQTGTDELWLDVVVEDSQMGSRVRLHLSPYEHLAYSGDSNAFPSSGDVGIGTLTPTEKLDVNGNVKAEFYYGSAEHMDNIWADDIQNNAITSEKILDGEVQWNDIAYNHIYTSHIVDGEIKWNDIANHNIYDYHIVDNTITYHQIGPNAVQQSELASNAVTTAHLADDAVTTSDIKNGEVTWNDIGLNAIGTGHIYDGQIGSADIGDNAVGKSQLATAAGRVQSFDYACATWNQCPTYVTGTTAVYTFVDCGTEGGFITASMTTNVQTWGFAYLTLAAQNIGNIGSNYYNTVAQAIVSGSHYASYDAMNASCPCIPGTKVRVEFQEEGGEWITSATIIKWSY